MNLDPNAIALAVHILFAGLWIGADLGTFLSYRRVLDENLDIPSRKAMAGYFAWIDMGPRSALIVMFGLGIYLAFDRGFGFQQDPWRALAIVMMVLSIVWLVGIWYLHWVQHPRAGETRSSAHNAAAGTIRKLDIGWRAVVLVFLLVAGVGTLSSKNPALLDVLGWKMILLAAIVAIGIVMRFVLPSVLGTLGSIFVDGSTPEREAQLKRQSVPVQLLVFGIWILVMLIIWTSVSNL
ncbi:MAG: hypothetical protein ACR2N2_09035 [Acidimicrobiia bacterium]